MFKLLKIHERKIYGGLVLFFLSLNFLIWARVFDLSGKAELTVRFFDVGQGDAILTVWMLYTHSYSKLGSLI